MFHVKQQPVDSPAPVRHRVVMAGAGWVWVALLLWPGVATAQKLYKCTGPGGSAVFSDQPCATGQGGEIMVKPQAGNAKPTSKPDAKADPATTGAMAKRNAEYEALLSPECRRARQQFLTKAQQPGGMDELMKDGNPVSKAWEACEFEAKDSLSKLSAQDQAKQEAEARKRREQESVAQRQNECATKRQAIESRRARWAQLSEQDRAAVQVVERDVAQNCR